jgi:hypothetical protein
MLVDHAGQCWGCRKIHVLDGGAEMQLGEVLGHALHLVKERAVRRCAS